MLELVYEIRLTSTGVIMTIFYQVKSLYLSPWEGGEKKEEGNSLYTTSTRLGTFDKLKGVNQDNQRK